MSKRLNWILLCYVIIFKTSIAFLPEPYDKYSLLGTRFQSSRPRFGLISLQHSRSSRREDDTNDDGPNSDENRYQEWKQKQGDVERKVRLQIQSDEEAAKNVQDCSFDLVSEMSKVESISPGLPLNSPEQLMDEHVSKLESELQAAVHAFDLPKAQQYQDDISQIHLDDCGSVLQINSAFYRAFSEKDAKAMESIWWHDGSVQCIHPSHLPIVGATSILDSYQRLFESLSASQQKHWIEPTHLRLVVKGCTAIVTCDEHIYARRFVRGSKRETELMNRLTATNIFRKVADKWYLVHHHASWHADLPVSQMALQQQQQQPPPPSASTASGKSTSRKSSKSNSQDTTKTGLNPAGILGSKDFGPFLGNKEAPQQPTVKKIVVGGSLSDFLNVNLSDIINSSGLDDSGAIIKISDIEQDDYIMDEDEDSDENNDDDDDDDEDDEDLEDVDDDVSTFVKELHLIREQNRGSSASKHQQQQQSTTMTTSKKWKTDSTTQDSIRQSCIRMLRQLADRGCLSVKQKRVLLTDIITCSARGEYSMVEVAYELLCEGNDDQDLSEEEFADQCHVFYESLTSQSQ
jgi:ketosteroid isomerase-like protein